MARPATLAMARLRAVFSMAEQSNFRCQRRDTLLSGFCGSCQGQLFNTLDLEEYCHIDSKEIKYANAKCVVGRLNRRRMLVACYSRRYIQKIQTAGTYLWHCLIQLLCAEWFKSVVEDATITGFATG